MSLQSKQSLQEKLADKKYRDAFVASRISQTIAFQSRVLRQRAGLSQDELAKELGTSQNAVSRMESPKYGKASISTLRKLASFFDVGLVVRFAAFSEIANWALSASLDSVKVPTFETDGALKELDKPQNLSGFAAAATPKSGTAESRETGAKWPTGSLATCETKGSFSASAHFLPKKSATSELLTWTGTLGPPTTRSGIQIANPLQTGITAT